MYKVNRENGRVVITDWKGKIIYSVEGDAIIIYSQIDGSTASARAGKLEDEQLLIALSKAVELPFLRD
jgi:hypothetical protein